MHRFVGIVNREGISHEDVVARIRLLLISSGQPLTPDTIHQLYPQVLRQLIDEILQRQQAQKHKIVADPKETKERIAQIEERNNMPKGGLLGMLRAHGIPTKSFIQQLEASMVWSKYIERKYASQLNISPRDVQRFLARWRADHKHMQYQLAEIVLQVGENRNPSPVMAHAQQILEWLYQGAPFSKIAQQFSQAPSKEHNGILGWRGLNRIDPALHKTVQTAAIGDFLGPIPLPCKERPSKIVILVVLDKQDPKSLALKEPDPLTVEGILRGEILERWSQKERDDLRKRGHYEIRKEPVDKDA